MITHLNKICRNYLWGGGKAEYQKAPYVSWDTVCTPKNEGGLGIKNLNMWNKASIAKLIWVIAKKKDNLWVQWVHGRYLKRGRHMGLRTSWGHKLVLEKITTSQRDIQELP